MIYDIICAVCCNVLYVQLLHVVGDVVLNSLFELP